MKRYKKSSLFKLILGLILWASIIDMWFFYPPEGLFLPAFFLILFFALYLLLSLFLPLSLSVSAGTVVFLLLRFFHMDNIGNNILLIGLCIALAVYESR